MADGTIGTTNATRGDRVDGGVLVGVRNGVRWVSYDEKDFAPMCAAFDAPAVAQPDRREEDAVVQFGGDAARLSLYADRVLNRATDNQQSWLLDETWIAYVTTLHARHGWSRRAPTASALLTALRVTVVPVPATVFGAQPDENEGEREYEATAAIDDNGRTTLLIRDDLSDEYRHYMHSFGAGVGMLADLVPQLHGITLSMRSLHLIADAIVCMGRMAFVPTRIAREAMNGRHVLAAAKHIESTIDLDLPQIENRLAEMSRTDLLHQLEDLHVMLCAAAHNTLMRLAELPFVSECLDNVSMGDHAPAGTPWTIKRSFNRVPGEVA